MYPLYRVLLPYVDVFQKFFCSKVAFAELVVVRVL